MNKKLLVFIFYCLISLTAKSQETFPVYTDYLSDNVFLIHPSAAGIGNCSKLRITARQQLLGIEAAPSLQTLSFHSRINDKMALGGILFNDKNGFHSQKGIIGSYAYHLNFGRDDALEQLSFGLSFMYVQNTVDQRSFTSTISDPVISRIIESSNYYNADASVAYHFLDVYGYLTVKNLLLSARDLESSSFESLNLRRYLLTLGYYFGRGKSFQFEPSIMGQIIERTGEFFVDFNMKAYKMIQSNIQLWAVLSYRQSFEGNTFESLKQITPILGMNYKRFMVSYTYTYQLGEIVLDNGGSHQITVGVNVFCKKQRSTGCPNINSMF
jgi:type IX secretion system PorP/SprF family membrane protein